MIGFKHRRAVVINTHKMNKKKPVKSVISFIYLLKMKSFYSKRKKIIKWENSNYRQLILILHSNKYLQYYFVG